MEAEPLDQPGDNRLLTGIDKDSLRVLLEWSDHLAKAKSRKGLFLILNSVIRLAVESPGKGIVPHQETAEGYGFSNKEVAALLGWDINDPYQLKKINQHWQSLVRAEWERYSSGLQQRLEEINSPCEFIPDQVRSVGRVPNLFFVRFKQGGDIVKNPNSNKNQNLGKMGIRYFQDEKNQPKGLIARLLRNGIRRKGSLHLFILIIILLGLFVGTMLSISIFTITDTLYALVGMIGMGWLALRSFRWISRYTQGPMVPVPNLLQDGLYNDLMLEWRTEFTAENATEADSEMQLFLSRYSGVCPVCGRIVRVCDGGREYPERIVGICEAAPSEHVFSYDPTTATGYPLREWLRRT